MWQNDEHTDKVGLFDELIADAWPPAVTERLGDWRLRWAWGLTRRANSVLTSGDPGCSLQKAVNLSEDFYTTYGQPARFQLGHASAPPTLAKTLEERGYRPDAPTLVQAASASTVTTMKASDDWDITLSDHPQQEWFAAYWSASGEPVDGAELQLTQERHRSTLLRPATDTVFVHAVRDGVVGGIGQGVAQSPWAGVQCMATVPDQRRRGAASAVLRAIGQWAQSKAIPSLYLGVMQNNDAARRLYARAGFTEVGGYVYWVAPTRP
jgi:GNAT superfamily N-acetyltransferase